VSDNSGGVVQGVADFESQVIDTSKGLGHLLWWIIQPGNWVRIVKVAAGVGLVIVGAAIVIKKQEGPSQ
jgi:hypothetical protein